MRPWRPEHGDSTRVSGRVKNEPFASSSQMHIAIVEVGDEPQLVQRQHDSVRREDRCKMEQMARSTHSMAEGATGGSGGDKSAQNFSRKFLVGVGRGAEVCRPRQLGNDAGPDEPQRDSWVRKWERGKGSRVPRGRVMGQRE